MKKDKIKKRKIAKWQKLDNTANLFPAIANNTMTNVYRISVILNEPVDGNILQTALDTILPDFDTFNVRMKKGIFWYYFETNNKKPPIVTEEDDFPCRFIESYANNNYLFRVTYFKCRINLEVFHVLADGMGGFNFLRELTYEYLRLKHPDELEGEFHGLSDETSLSTEDSYIKNFRKGHAKEYKTKRAVEVKGEKLIAGGFGVIHGYVSVDKIKAVSRQYNASINEYLVALFIYNIYKEYLHGQSSSKSIASCVPVNLRPYFDSMTTRNFFVMVSAVFTPKKDNYTFEEVVDIVKESLRSQINKEHLEDLFSYNVSNQKNILLRSVPIFIKIPAMKFVYRSSAKANTTTLTNVGNIVIDDKYKPYIKNFQSMISVSTGQNIKCGVCSYDGTMVITFTSILKDVSIQKGFFRMLTEADIPVMIESNGVYYE